MAAAVAVAAIMHKLNSHANLKSKKNWKAIYFFNDVKMCVNALTVY